MKKLTKENLENVLTHLKGKRVGLEKVFFDQADSRCGNRVALARNVNDLGGIEILTDYLSLKEMHAFLLGYLSCSDKRFY
jgi:hypothetical protein